MVEIAGIFAVVASLIFVGLQLRLDRKVAVAEQYFNRAESAKADRRAMLESDDYMQFRGELWALGDRPSFWDESSELAAQVADGSISVRSLRAGIVSLQLSVIGYDNVYFQYQQGLIEDEMWNHLRSTMKRNMAGNEIVRQAYSLYARPTIRPIIDEILKEIEAEGESQPPSD